MHLTLASFVLNGFIVILHGGAHTALAINPITQASHTDASNISTHQRSTRWLRSLQISEYFNEVDNRHAKDSFGKNADSILTSKTRSFHYDYELVVLPEVTDDKIQDMIIPDLELFMTVKLNSEFVVLDEFGHEGNNLVIGASPGRLDRMKNERCIKGSHNCVPVTGSVEIYLDERISEHEIDEVEQELNKYIKKKMEKDAYLIANIYIVDVVYVSSELQNMEERTDNSYETASSREEEDDDDDTPHLAIGLSLVAFASCLIPCCLVFCGCRRQENDEEWAIKNKSAELPEGLSEVTLEDSNTCDLSTTPTPFDISVY